MRQAHVLQSTALMAALGFGRIELAMAPFSHHLIVDYAPERSARLDEAALGLRSGAQARTPSVRIS